MRILVTGGGTGGHTTPAVATIQALREISAREGSEVEFEYLGSKHGMESRSASDLGVRFVGIETGKLRRSRSLIGLFSLKNIVDAARVPIGYAQALSAVRRFRPDVVLSTGGYVSVPGVLAAGALRIPVVAHEQTVQVGLANRINFKVAAKIALSVDETMQVLPQKQRQRAVVTGNPVRAVVLNGDADKARREFGFAEADGLPVVYVTGGAQGSQLINRAIEGAVERLLEISCVIHQCGRQTGDVQYADRLNAVREKLPETLRNRYAITEFVGPEIGDVFALSSLIVSRSGAGTVTELCAVGKPALFVPLVPTGGDEQTRNAKRLVEAGAAEMIRQSELSPDTLVEAIGRMLADRARLEQMGRCARSMARPDAAKELALLVMDLGREGHV